MSASHHAELVRLGLIEDDPLSGSASLAEAKAFVFERIDMGVDCPCCDQFAKRYTRKFSSGLARVLIALVGCSNMAEETPWVHVREFEHVSREVHKLAYWGLAVSDREQVEGKKATGFWQPTPKGLEFVKGKIRVSDKVITYNGKVEGFEGSGVAIWETLGEKFNYQELMATTPGLSGVVAWKREPAPA